MIDAPRLTTELGRLLRTVEDDLRQRSEDVTSGTNQQPEPVTFDRDIYRVIVGSNDPWRTLQPEGVHQAIEELHDHRTLFFDRYIFTHTSLLNVG